MPMTRTPQARKESAPPGTGASVPWAMAMKALTPPLSAAALWGAARRRGVGALGSASGPSGFGGQNDPRHGLYVYGGRAS